ncbi:hypothetical protein PQX77_013116 [Marasmius sp. AFHP31]|nr:hypothetical protein PQX77_013116 [Marasmius sp. AFHP31]
MTATVLSSGSVLLATQSKRRNIKNLRLHVPAGSLGTVPPPPPPAPVPVLRPHWHPGPKSSDKLILARSNAQRGEWTKVVLHRDQEIGKSSHGRKGFLGLLSKVKIERETYEVQTGAEGAGQLEGYQEEEEGAQGDDDNKCYGKRDDLSSWILFGQVMKKCNWSICV